MCLEKFDLVKKMAPDQVLTFLCLRFAFPSWSPQLAARVGTTCHFLSTHQCSLTSLSSHRRLCALPHDVPWAPNVSCIVAAALSVLPSSMTLMVPWPGQCPQLAEFPLICIITYINSRIIDWLCISILSHAGKFKGRGHGP